MRDYISIGSSPCDEDCAQVGSDNFREKALKECRQYIEAIRKKYGLEKGSAQLKIKWFPHDFGSYCEVVCYYSDDDEAGMNYAYNVELGTETWSETGHAKP